MTTTTTTNAKPDEKTARLRIKAIMKPQARTEPSSVYRQRVKDRTRWVYTGELPATPWETFKFKRSIY